FRSKTASKRTADTGTCSTATTFGSGPTAPASANLAARELRAITGGNANECPDANRHPSGQSAGDPQNPDRRARKGISGRSPQPHFAGEVPAHHPDRRSGG